MKPDFGFDFDYYYIKFPDRTSGDIVEKMLKIIERDKEYDVWTLNEKLEVVQCKGIIKNNESWNYHNNYDNSEDELYVQLNKHKGFVKQWFSLNKRAAVKAQQTNISQLKKLLQKELDRLDKIKIELEE